jgi:hypothetical protein
MSTTTTNLDEMKDRVSLFSIGPEFKPPFQNLPRSEVQPAPADWFNSTHPFVLDWYREGDGWLVQCAFCLLPSHRNNHYVVWIMDWKGQQLYHAIMASHTVYPPVWDRSWGGLDYTDYVSIQQKVQRLMERHGLAGFEVDETLEGKFVHMVKETPDQIRALLADGKPYSILAIRAEAARDKLSLKSVTPILS